MDSGQSAQAAVREKREKQGMKTSWVGIFVNTFLFVFKFAAGTLSGSISVRGDAFNNLSDAASAAVALLSFRLSAKPADDRHPFGHARTEYLGTSIVAVIILIIAYELGSVSVAKIRTPEAVAFSGLMAAALIVSVITKITLYFYYRRQARAIRSDLLAATAKDAMGDVAASAAVLAGLLIHHWTGLNTDGWLGLLVAVFIAYQGFTILREMYDRIMGQSPDPELAQELTKKILSYPEVLGLHDLVIHDYGPGRQFATVHVEVDAREDILVSHEMIDNIERDSKLTLDVELLIHIDPIVMNDPEVNAKRTEVSLLVNSIDPRLSMHDFRMVKAKDASTLIFEVTIPSGMSEAQAEETRDRIQAEIETRHSDYETVIILDRNYTTNQPDI